MRRRCISLHLSALLVLAVALHTTISPAFCERKSNGSSISLEDSIKDLKDSLRDLRDALKGKKTDKPDAERSSQPDASEIESKPTGQVFISVSKDGTESVSGLSAGDRLWTKASTEELAAVTDIPQMHISPPMDINKLTQAQYNGAVSAAMEAMRDLMGKLTPDEEAKFSAKWAPLFGFPTEASVTYMNKLNPLLSEFLSLRGAVAAASLEFDGAWEEAVLSASYDSEEGAREALALAAIQKDSLLSLQARMVKVAQAIQTLGNPPDPIQAQQQARKRHQAAIQTSVNMVPSVTISPAKVNGKPNVPYAFTAKMHNIAGKVTINWSFGDGVVAKGSAVSTNHTYKKVGNYTVRAVVYDAMKSKITEASADVTIANESKTMVWVLADKTLDKLVAEPVAGAPSQYSWKISDTTVESEHRYLGKLWSHYQYSWEEPPTRLVPGTKVNLKINLKALPGASYLSSPTDKAEIMMSVTGDQYSQSGITKNAYLQLNNFNVKNDSKTEGSDAVEFSVPSTANISGLLKVTVLIEQAGQTVRTVYIYKMDLTGSAEPAPAAGSKETAPSTQPTEEAAEKARRETVDFHKSNIVIIERNLAKDREELSRETDPTRRASLEFRILQGMSDAQAEKDLIVSLETGQSVHTRTAFDDYAHAQFVHNIRENQREMESFQRASAALYRLAGMLPPGEAQDAREFVDKQLTIDVRTKMDHATVNEIASALDNKVQGHYQAEAAKNEENAVWANLGLEAAQNIKAAADAGMTVCSIFGGKPINLVYQATTGYIEGGPVEAVLKTASTFGTTAQTAVEAFKGYKEGGLEGAASRGATTFLTSKAFEYGVSKVLGGAKPSPKKPTVKEQLELAKFKQARSDGESLVKSFQRAQSQMEAAARAGKPARELSKLQAELRDKAAAINSSPHAKNFLKYRGDFHAQRAYNAHMKAVHAEVEAKFHDRMTKQGWNKQQLREFRNTASAGSVGMDYDIGLDELAGNALTKNGQRATVHQWQTDAQKAWDQAYKDTTKRSAGMAWENVTTSVHAESYKDLAWLGSDKTKVMSVWAQQSADVTRYKAWHMLNDPSLSRLEALQEVSRGTAKDISTKLQPLLNNAKASTPASTESLQQTKAHWQKIQTTLDAFGNNTIDPIAAERRIRELTGGKGIPEVVNDVGTVMEGLIKSLGTK